MSATVSDQQQLEPLLRLHDRGERLGGARIGKVAPLGHVGHDEMLLDEPGDALGVGGRQPEPRTEPARDLGAGLRMVGRPALGDVVQESGEIELGAVRDLVDEISLDSGWSSFSRPASIALSTPTVRIRCSSTV